MSPYPHNTNAVVWHRWNRGQVVKTSGLRAGVVSPSSSLTQLMTPISSPLWDAIR